VTVLVPLAPLPPGTWMRRPRRRLPFPLDQPRCHLLARGLSIGEIARHLRCSRATVRRRLAVSAAAPMTGVPGALDEKGGLG